MRLHEAFEKNPDGPWKCCIGNGAEMRVGEVTGILMIPFEFAISENWEVVSPDIQVGDVVVVQGYTINRGMNIECEVDGVEDDGRLRLRAYEYRFEEKDKCTFIRRPERHMTLEEEHNG